jgi:hypothetical protein
MRIILKATLAVAAGLATLTSAAHATDSGWWNIGDDAIKTALKRAALGGADRMRAFALCSAKRNPKAVDILLATPQDSAAETSASRRMTQLNFDCMPNGVFTLGGLSVRGSLAEARFWTSFADADVQTLAVRSDEKGEKERFADCAADGRMGEIRALIATAPQSAEETAALSPLMAGLRNCIGKTSFTSMDNASVRALMAESLYRAAKRGGKG